MVKTNPLGALAAAVGALVAVGSLTLMMLVVEVRPAEAAFPGKNGKIAFMGLRNSDIGTTNNWDIYTVNADGSELVNITNSPLTSEQFPAWSSDGTKIAFTMRSQAAGGAGDIYVMNADGSGQKRLTDESADDVFPTWSPDGSKIAFMSNRANSIDIFIMDADGGNVMRLTNNARLNIRPVWSPDGTRIAFTSETPGLDESKEIYTINVDGTGQTALTNNETDDLLHDWSPDGQHLLAQGVPSDSSFGGIYIMNADGTEQRRLTGGSESTWSPDGTRIAFQTGSATGDRIATLDLNTGEQTFITDTPDLQIVSSDWQPQPTTPSDTTPPWVISNVPKANADEVVPTANVRATFSEKMRPSSITGQSFKLFKKGTTTQIAAQVSYNADTETAKLDPINNLRRGVAYKAVVTTWAKDLAGNRLDQVSSTSGLQQKRWFFRVDD